MRYAHNLNKDALPTAQVRAPWSQATVRALLMRKESRDPAIAAAIVKIIAEPATALGGLKAKKVL